MPCCCLTMRNSSSHNAHSGCVSLWRLLRRHARRCARSGLIRSRALAAPGRPLLRAKDTLLEALLPLVPLVHSISLASSTWSRSLPHPPPPRPFAATRSRHRRPARSRPATSTLTSPTRPRSSTSASRASKSTSRSSAPRARTAPPRSSGGWLSQPRRAVSSSAMMCVCVMRVVCSEMLMVGTRADRRHWRCSCPQGCRRRPRSLPAQQLKQGGGFLWSLAAYEAPELTQLECRS